MTHFMIHNVDIRKVDWLDAAAVTVYHPLLGWLDGLKLCDHCEKLHPIWSLINGLDESRDHMTVSSIFRVDEPVTPNVLTRIRDEIFEVMPTVEHEHITFHVVRESILRTSTSMHQYGRATMPPMPAEYHRMLDVLDYIGFIDTSEENGQQRGDTPEEVRALYKKDSPSGRLN